MTPKAQAGSIRNGLYRDILTSIVSGEYPPETALPTEGGMADDYGISRSVVRSALEMLKQRGIIRSRQGSGTVVACRDPKNLTLPDFSEQLPILRDCYACRLAIEPEIAAQLAVRQSPAATAYLVARSDELDRQSFGGSQVGGLATARDADFHVRLAEFSQNGFFFSIMVGLRPHILFSMNVKKYLSRSAQTNHINLSGREHLKIIAAILDRDAGNARKFIYDHITNGRDRVFGKDWGSRLQLQPVEAEKRRSGK